MSLELLVRSMEGFADSIEGLGASIAINRSKDEIQKINEEFAGKDEERMAALTNLQSTLSSQLAALGAPNTQIAVATGFVPSPAAQFQIASQEKMQQAGFKNQQEIASIKAEKMLSPSEKLQQKILETTATEKVKAKIGREEESNQINSLLSGDWQLAEGKLATKKQVEEFNSLQKNGKDLFSLTGQLMEKAANDNVGVVASLKDKDISSIYNQLLPTLNKLEGLGALAQGDLAILKGQIPNPSNVRATAEGSKEYAIRLRQWENRIIDRILNGSGSTNFVIKGAEKNREILNKVNSILQDEKKQNELRKSPEKLRQIESLRQKQYDQLRIKIGLS